MENEQQSIIIQPDNPMSVLTLFDADKKGLDYFIDYVANTIESGMDDPLKVLAISKKMEYLTKRINERIKEQQKTAADKYGDRPFEYLGTEMRYMAVHTEYDYSGCNYPQLNGMMGQVKSIQEFLKALKEPMDIRVDDELVTVRPPRKIETFGLRTTVK